MLEAAKEECDSKIKVAALEIQNAQNEGHEAKVFHIACQTSQENGNVCNILVSQLNQAILNILVFS